MDAKSLFDTCVAHGYRSIPTSERVLLDAADLDRNTDVSPDQLLELASVVEFFENNLNLFLNQKDQIELSDHDRMKGVCLTLYSDDVSQIEKFRSLCYTNIPKELNWFHQCNTGSYQMFEFWNPQSAAMRICAQWIALEMKMPVIVALKKDYRPDVDIVLSAFQPFDPDMCQRGNFFGS